MTYATVSIVSRRPHLRRLLSLAQSARLARGLHLREQAKARERRRERRREHARGNRLERRSQ